MTKSHYNILLFSFFSGLIVCLLHKKIIIIQNPFDNRQALLPIVINKKDISLFFRQNNVWHTEKTTIIWDEENREQTIQLVINNLLTFLYDIDAIQTQPILHSALFGSHKSELFLSFNQYPFTENMSIGDKWSLIEAILKTIREEYPTIQQIRFLVSHQPLSDPHLDFSHSWPTSGFIS